MLAKGSKEPILVSIGLAILFILSSSLFRIPIFIFISILGVLQLIFVVYFFRDPDRNVPENNMIVSPADGKIHVLDRSKNEIEIFMNIWDVHVNRSPWSGKIETMKQINGGYSPAFSKNSNSNERQLYVLSTEEGDIDIWQISGIFARRIIPYVKKDDQITRGQKIGMIRFGSRVKLKFHNGVDFSVQKGERVKAGETILGNWDE